MCGRQITHEACASATDQHDSKLLVALVYWVDQVGQVPGPSFIQPCDVNGRLKKMGLSR